MDHIVDSGKPGSSDRKVHLISLGCSRNRVDSEVMLGTMMGSGWKSTDAPDDADAIVINTCGFIAAAKEESIESMDHIEMTVFTLVMGRFKELSTRNVYLTKITWRDL
ncbi:hypothetical protein E3A20_14520, partial [Planctomyces bekefii]